LSARTRRCLAAAVLAATIQPGVSHAASASARAQLETGLRIIEGSYLFEDRLETGRLLGAALEAVEAAIPRAHAFQVSPTAHVLETGDCRLHLEVARNAQLSDLAPSLAAAADLVDQCVPDKPSELPSTVTLLMAGVLSDLDPYSTVFDSRGKREHTIQFRGKLAGIGARIGTRREVLTLITVYPDSPAARAGLRDKDQVTRIDGVSTTNMRVGDAVEKIRGDVGTQVVLTIARDDEPDSRDVTVTRGLVTIPSVAAKVLESGNIYVAISHFSQTTPEDFRSHVEELLGTNRRRGVIIDLRSNSGGSMLGASAIADAFIDDGLLITTAGRHGERVMGLTGEVRATADSPFRECPVAILTSQRTASGSELMAAGLRNNDRAVFVGQRTFGKGTVQKTYALGAEEALKLTVGNFLPRGLAIPAGGLVPDVEIRTLVLTPQGYRAPLPAPDPEDMEFWQRNPEWLDVEPSRNPVVMPFFRDVSSETAPEAEEEAGDEMLPDDPVADPAVAVADDLLHRHGSTSASRMLADAAAFLAERAERAGADLEAALTERGVDWTGSATATPSEEPEPKPALEWNPKNTVMLAGTESEIEIRITNPSKRPLYRVRAVLDAEIGFLRGITVPVGRIDAGATATTSFKVKTPSELRLARLTVEVSLEDDSGRIGEYGPMHLFVDESARPHLAHRITIVQGEEPDVLELQISIANRGSALAGEIRLQLVHSEFGAAELLEGATTFPSLAADQTLETHLHVKLLETPVEPPSVDLMIFESEHRILVQNKVRLAHMEGQWLEPPRITLSHVEETASDDGTPSFAVIARVTDDAGLVEVRTAVDGDRKGFFDMTTWPAQERRFMLPWHVDAKSKRYEVVATDTDGLVARYVTDL
jgi:carboxyl-terminal processing protease